MFAWLPCGPYLPEPTQISHNAIGPQQGYVSKDQSVGGRSWAGPPFSLRPGVCLKPTELFWNLTLKGRDVSIAAPSWLISPRISPLYVADPDCRFSLHVFSAR